LHSFVSAGIWDDPIRPRRLRAEEGGEVLALTIRPRRLRAEEGGEFLAARVVLVYWVYWVREVDWVHFVVYFVVSGGRNNVSDVGIVSIGNIGV
jgi:hypothetical protein